MPRHIVCLTFDFDALSLPIAKGTITPTALSRGEFGLVGVTRIRELLKAQKIQATFFVPGHTIETFPDAVAALVADGHEIAHHGWTHRRPADLSRAEERDELVRANAAIERISGRAARGYRSPSWDLSAHTLDLLLEFGFLYDSSLMGHDHRPYRPRAGDRTPLLEPARLGDPVDLIEIPVSWSLDDYPHFEWSVTSAGALNQGLSSWRAVLDNWTADFDYMARSLDWGVITYTFHPFVSGRGHRLTALEALIRHVRAQGATFARMEDVAREAAARLGPLAS
jgi:peptidoglycan/xylan/chitin deacetylase (PgdA/CDA1 family)